MHVLSPLARGWVMVVLAGLFCTATETLAEPRPKKGKPAEAAADEKAQVRLWKDVFATDRAVKIILRQGKKTAVEVRLAEGLQFLDYQEIPAGQMVVEVTDEADGNARLVTTNIAFDGGDFFTLLVQENDGKIGIEVIDDARRSGATTGELSVRSFAPMLTSLRVKIGEDLNVKLDGPAPFARFRGLARQTVQVDTTGMEAGGKQVNWANEIDFRAIPRATLLILPDAYGRIRPRVLVDGAAR